MSEHIELGKKGELLALEFLVEKEYKIRATNYRSGRFEIDIIAEKDQTLVFVEVKTRQNKKYGLPEAAISASKAQNVMYAAENYIYRFNWQNNIRFDVISIVIQENEIEHMEDAFY